MGLHLVLHDPNFFYDAQFAGDGNTILDAAPFGLAGMPAAYLIAQMKAFASGARPASV